MGKEHAPETVWKGQELYCVDRLSFEAVARALGVADSTVRRWADRFNWRAEREEIARAESEIRANMVKARAHMLEKLLRSQTAGDAAQGAFGVSALEKLEQEKQKILARQEKERDLPASRISQDEKTPVEAPPAQEIPSLPEGLDDAERVALLEQALDRQLAYVLANPVPDVSRRVREIKAAMDVLASLRGKDDKGQGISIAFDEEE